MYRLKKSLGQHFLKDQHIIQKIVGELGKIQFNNLLEVGPGGGALTSALIQIENIHFKTVEIDDEKVAYLKKKFTGLEIIHKNFLDLEKPFDMPFTIIGNFPYNISSQILFKIIDWFPDVTDTIGMFQKEVAERVVSKPGTKDYGILSVLVQYYFETSYLFSVSKACFNPPPKVESGVIKLTARKDLLPVKSESSYKKLVKASFAQRRKTLRNNLKGIIHTEKLSEPLFDRRAETLSVEEYAALSFFM